MGAKYWIAQHIPDLFRNEPRNVGVVVEAASRRAAVFFGETQDRQVDGRKLRGWAYPDVYRQWIEFWRSELEDVGPQGLVENSGSHYRVIEGGEIDDANDAPPTDIAAYLYALLISEGGFAEALAEPQKEVGDESPAQKLQDELESAFSSLNLLTNSLRHPIEKSRRLVGVTSIEHQPAFTQENGRLYVMETVDFTMKKRRLSRDHAGLSAYMFKDLRAKDSHVEPISVVRIEDDDLSHEDVRYGIAVLKAESRLVNWLNTEERNDFLEERQAVASGKQ
ncbi:MAG: hypothetical protein H6729_08535 [Deltaproteobacteria bacterium]|nr:hypothetical protein [Deltaproteobacteria bacterium]